VKSWVGDSAWACPPAADGTTLQNLYIVCYIA